ncbi:MAG: type II toxin-antitoxin system Phd/YefM family antitoxin [Alphaproteobacteria bacterium]|nr:type II toxin-antitoxin system Phd/YefM family antitoxin [Alphaproteobacteria bacterium]USO07485.1 MAG: type II toxin-antitoxin system Phd/YefM family antitoxin [Rhodospirillales bacterium]
MEIFNISHAKTHLSALVARVEAGEEIVIGRADKPLCKLVPYIPADKPCFVGAGAGRIAVPPVEAFNLWDDEIAEALTMDLFQEAA